MILASFAQACIGEWQWGGKWLEWYGIIDFL